MELINIHTDERRDIHLIKDLLKENREFTIINLNAGKAIGGCVHKDTEYFCIIEGEGTYVTIYDGKRNEVGYIKGEHSVILPNTAHAFIAKTDSIIIEWGVKVEDKNNHNIKLREEVNKINGIQ